MAAIVIFLLFFISGISGLVYQVIWVREFGFIFGSTVQSAALVTAVFMCGLGLGSFVIGRWSDRKHADNPALPLRAYGYSEIGIAILGIIISLILPELESFSATFAHYTQGPEGWEQIATSSHLFRFAIACTLLTPITFIMGGTLTLLIRYLLISDLSAVGWRVGALYGINTAGAALGAFISDFSLIPELGIRGAQGIAIGLNAISGLGALLLLRSSIPSTVKTTPAAEHVPVIPKTSPDTRRLVLGTTITLFISGFVAMGFEIIWFRYLISGLGGFRAIFSLMMTVILMGIFLGAFLGGFLERRFGSPAKLYIIAQTLLIASVIVPLVLVGSKTYTPFGTLELLAAAGPSAFMQKLAGIAINLQSIVFIVGMPALLMGFTFPLANAHIQRVQSSIGANAGSLYLANTLGNVTGSVMTGFVFLPLLGQHHSITLLAICGAIGLLPLYLTVKKSVITKETMPALIIVSSALVLVTVIITWSSLSPKHLLRNTKPLEADHKLIAISEGVNENIVIVDEGDQRRLFTNGHSMSSTSIYAQRYMRLFTHLPLLNSPKPEKALVICFGVGSTTHSVSLYPSIKEIEVADLSKNVLRNSHHFVESNKGVLDDPRLTVYVNDGRQHLRLQAINSYDLITLEPPPIAHAGIAALYSVEFYELAKSRLKDHGYMTQWLPAYQVTTEVNLSIIRSFLDVFPNAVLLSGSKTELILMAAKSGPTQLDSTTILKHINSNRAIKEDLAAIGVASLTEMAATFVAGPEVLDLATKNAPPVTDDNPLMEYAHISAYHKTRLPSSVFDASEIENWCPDCFNGRAVSRNIKELPQLMESLNTYYHSDEFLDHMSNMPESHEKIKYSRNPCYLNVVKNNFYFKNVFQCQPKKK